MGEDVAALTQAFRDARQRFLTVKAEEQTALAYYRPSTVLVKELREAYERAAIDLANEIAGPT